MPVRLTYHGSPNASSILQEGFRPGRMLSVAPGQVFSTPNVNFASGYGNPVKMATSTNAFSLPSINFSSGQIGKEVIQSPKNATRGMQLAQMAERLKNVSPTAARLLGGETIKGIAASSIGRSALARTVGTLLGGTVAGTAGILTSPYIAIANHLYGPNVGKAHDFVGMSGEAMPFSGDADMYPEYSSYLGKQGTSQTLSDTVLAEPTTGIMNIETPKGFDYNFDENVLKEEEDAQYNLDNKRSFNMEGILQNLGDGLQKTAQYYGGSQIGAGLGSLSGLGPLGIAIGALTGGKFFGGADTSMTPMDRYNQNTFGGYGNMGVQDRYGINTVSLLGNYNKYANKMANKPGPFQSYYQDVVNKQNKQETQQFADIRQQSESSGGYNPSTGYTAETASGLEGTGGSHHGYSTDYSSPF
jgi:hypothetical protein